MQSLDMAQDMAHDMDRELDRDMDRGTDRNVAQEPVTIGELCEAILNGRVKADVHDGYYEVAASELRRVRRVPEDPFATLERLRPRLCPDDLALDAGCFDEIRPGGEDIA